MLAPSPPLTAIYHGAEDAALRILPAVAPMCIDPVGDVRSSALQVCVCGGRNRREMDSQVWEGFLVCFLWTAARSPRMCCNTFPSIHNCHTAMNSYEAVNALMLERGTPLTGVPLSRRASPKVTEHYAPPPPP